MSNSLWFEELIILNTQTLHQKDYLFGGKGIVDKTKTKYINKRVLSISDLKISNESLV